MRDPAEAFPGASSAPPGASPSAPLLGLPYAVSVLASPARTFRDLAARPRRAWIGPMVLCAVLTAVATWITLPEMLDAAYDSAVSFMDRVGVPEGDRAEALARLPLDVTPRVVVTQVTQSALLTAVFLLVGAAFVHFVSRMFGASSAFGPTLGMFSVGYVIWALGGLVKGVLIAVSDTVDVTLGPGALIPGIPVLSPWGIFLDLFDVFSLWHVYVLAAGLAVVARASRGTAWGVALSYWVIRCVFLAGGKGFMLWTQGG